MKRKDYNGGFTIIEVALVLAVAGLIFLMAFIALPAVQRTQRDAKRRDDVGALLTAIQKYQNNNRGALPSGTVDIKWSDINDETTETSWAGLYKSFLGENFADPNGESNYVLSVKNCGAVGTGSECKNVKNIENQTFPNDYKMYVVISAACDGSKAIGSSNPRKVAVVYKMEGGGAYCASTQ